MGRRTSLASLAGGPVEDVPGRSDPVLVRLPLPQIASTLVNPRTAFGEDDLAELGESLRVRQLEPVVVASRGSYLSLWPEHTEHVGTAAYVLANGERRLRAARHVGLDRLDAVIREELTESRAVWLDAVLSENLDRKNLDPIEEARAVEAMIRECGTATAAAARFRRHETWVSQRRALLRLVPELQDLVRTGEMPLRVGRKIGTRPAELQMAAWLETRDAPAAAPIFTAVKIGGTDTAAPPAADGHVPEARQPSAPPAAEDVDEDLLDEAPGPDPAVEDVPLANTEAPDDTRPTGGARSHRRVAVPPVGRVPTQQAASTVLARYKRVYGADALASLLRDELDDDEAVTFVTAAASNMGADALDELIGALATLRSGR